ncbi:MAG: hypothetical protein ACLUL2_02360 [Blautia sp.]
MLYALYAVGIQDEKFYGSTEGQKDHQLPRKEEYLLHHFHRPVIVAGCVGMGVHKSQTGDGLNYSLEFIGGTSTNVTFNEDMSHR